jgi:hypothetical protein
MEQELDVKNNELKMISELLKNLYIKLDSSSHEGILL